MKRFIRYLYEYQNEKRIRNVGFIKVETGCEETIVHMQAKGFHNSNEQKLVLYLFYEENENIVSGLQKEVPLTSPVLDQQIMYSPNDVGGQEIYEKISGVLIETESGRRIAATWDDGCVDVSRFNMFSTNEDTEPLEEEDTVDEEVKEQVKITCTKISRQDISRLPHCEWQLANNQFLVHGYNNFHYLLLIDNGNHLKLGVPGIYHIEEAKCADTFGFEEFLSADELGIAGEWEGNQEELFGYWCRPVRRRRFR